MTIKKLAMLVIIAALLLSGCGGQTATPEAQAPAAPTNTSAPTHTATATVDTVATQNAQQTADAQATVDAKATDVAAKATQAALDKQATASQKTAAVETEKAQVFATSTAQVAAYQMAVDKLYDEGIVQAKEGQYYNLGEFEESMAQINTPFIVYLDYEAVDFIISSDLIWESASENANWPTSGCGFIYGYKDRFNADLTFLALDGYTNSLQFRQNKPVRAFAFKKWGDPERPRGEAKMTLVVSNKHVYVYVNGELANDFYNSLYTGGQLGLNIFSGTNAGYGTRCNFSNVELFIFD